MNLLIVNDEIRTADVMKRDILWTEYGIDEVFVAYEAESGKTMIRENDIDIMLCDIEMPGENGLALLQWVREQEREIECIFLTCHANFMYAQEAISLGCQDYILIPAKYEDIGKAVLKVAQRIRQRRSDEKYLEYGRHLLEPGKRPEEPSRKLTPEETVAQVRSYIINNLGETELSVNSIAEKFFFHPVYLNRIFKQVTEVSVSQFIINERMQKAAALLSLGELSATEVARVVGYNYYSNFHNTFKRFYGCTPYKYQEENRTDG